MADDASVQIERMVKAINAHGWDGEWFLRAYDFYGRKVGSRENEEGKIFIESQGMCVMAGMGLGFGVIISSLTTKYRDLQVLVAFGVQLWMYATPVIYPLSTMSAKYRWLIVANPMSAVVETFRYAFFGTGTFSWVYLGYSAGFTVVLLLAGMALFNRVERTFMDTV